MLSNREVAKRFFYPKRYISAQGSNFYFLYDSVISYSTLVAQRVQDKKGEDVLIVSDDTMSRSTGKQISQLYRYCNIDRYEAPFVYDRNKPFTLEGFATNFTNRLREIRERLDFTQKHSRDQYIDTFNRAVKFSEGVYAIADLEDFRQLYIDLQDPEYVSALKKAKRAKSAKKRAEAKEWHRRWQAEAEHLVAETSDYLECVELLYRAKVKTEYGVGLGQHIEQLLEAKLNPEELNRDYVLVFDGSYRTTRGNSVSMEAGDKALKLWKVGALQVGDHVGIFRVFAVTSTYIDIGCHSIPTENLRELYRQRFEESRNGCAI